MSADDLVSTTSIRGIMDLKDQGDGFVVRATTDAYSSPPQELFSDRRKLSGKIRGCNLNSIEERQRPMIDQRTHRTGGYSMLCDNVHKKASRDSGSFSSRSFPIDPVHLVTEEGGDGEGGAQQPQCPLAVCPSSRNDPPEHSMSTSSGSSSGKEEDDTVPGGAVSATVHFTVQHEREVLHKKTTDKVNEVRQSLTSLFHNSLPCGPKIVFDGSKAVASHDSHPPNKRSTLRDLVDAALSLCMYCKRQIRKAKPRCLKGPGEEHGVESQEVSPAERQLRDAECQATFHACEHAPCPRALPIEQENDFSDDDDGDVHDEEMFLVEPSRDVRVENLDFVCKPANRKMKDTYAPTKVTSRALEKLNEARRKDDEKKMKERKKDEKTRLEEARKEANKEAKENAKKARSERARKRREKADEASKPVKEEPSSDAEMDQGGELSDPPIHSGLPMEDKETSEGDTIENAAAAEEDLMKNLTGVGPILADGPSTSSKPSSAQNSIISNAMVATKKERSGEACARGEKKMSTKELARMALELFSDLSEEKVEKFWLVINEIDSKESLVEVMKYAQELKKEQEEEEAKRIQQNSTLNKGTQAVADNEKEPTSIRKPEDKCASDAPSASRHPTDADAQPSPVQSALTPRDEEQWSSELIEQAMRAPEHTRMWKPSTRSAHRPKLARMDATVVVESLVDTVEDDEEAAELTRKIAVKAHQDDSGGTLASVDSGARENTIGQPQDPGSPMPLPDSVQDEDEARVDWPYATREQQLREQLDERVRRMRAEMLSEDARLRLDSLTREQMEQAAQRKHGDLCKIILLHRHLRDYIGFEKTHEEMRLLNGTAPKESLARRTEYLNRLAQQWTSRFPLSTELPVIQLRPDWEALSVEQHKAFDREWRSLKLAQGILSEHCPWIDPSTAHKSRPKKGSIDWRVRAMFHRRDEIQTMNILWMEHEEDCERSLRRSGMFEIEDQPPGESRSRSRDEWLSIHGFPLTPAAWEGETNHTRPAPISGDDGWKMWTEQDRKQYEQQVMLSIVAEKMQNGLAAEELENEDEARDDEEKSEDEEEVENKEEVAEGEERIEERDEEEEETNEEEEEKNEEELTEEKEEKVQEEEDEGIVEEKGENAEEDEKGEDKNEEEDEEELTGEKEDKLKELKEDEDIVEEKEEGVEEEEEEDTLHITSIVEASPSHNVGQKFPSAVQAAPEIVYQQSIDDEDQFDYEEEEEEEEQMGPHDATATEETDQNDSSEGPLPPRERKGSAKIERKFEFELRRADSPMSPERKKIWDKFMDDRVFKLLKDIADKFEESRQALLEEEDRMKKGNSTEELEESMMKRKRKQLRELRRRYLEESAYLKYERAHEEDRVKRRFLLPHGTDLWARLNRMREEWYNCPPPITDYSSPRGWDAWDEAMNGSIRGDWRRFKASERILRHHCPWIGQCALSRQRYRWRRRATRDRMEEKHTLNKIFMQYMDDWKKEVKRTFSDIREQFDWWMRFHGFIATRLPWELELLQSRPLPISRPPQWSEWTEEDRVQREQEVLLSIVADKEGFTEEELEATDGEDEEDMEEEEDDEEDYQHEEENGEETGIESEQDGDDQNYSNEEKDENDVYIEDEVEEQSTYDGINDRDDSDPPSGGGAAIPQGFTPTTGDEKTSDHDADGDGDGEITASHRYRSHGKTSLLQPRPSSQDAQDATVKIARANCSIVGPLGRPQRLHRKRVRFAEQPTTIFVEKYTLEDAEYGERFVGDRHEDQEKEENTIDDKRPMVDEGAPIDDREEQEQRELVDEEEEEEIDEEREIEDVRDDVNDNDEGNVQETIRSSCSRTRVCGNFSSTSTSDPNVRDTIPLPSTQSLNPLVSTRPRVHAAMSEVQGRNEKLHNDVHSAHTLVTSLQRDDVGATAPVAGYSQGKHQSRGRRPGKRPMWAGRAWGERLKSVFKTC
ncbi:hypothetical protein PRIPAC_98049 [Pristionchus pacificus]|uniref:Uncharacterized protein n=1 Tax=Pristionchus pacificus TaxID=54126 RepID=A0A2A6B2X3_PRIPA|nr:hypothetical protein PRIPAC_98049 [Pristionchus pacificus]|eukprot:PDM60218.1 hypothetical protein PRIPAC_54043 [Pristionchus pacificus]